MSAKPPVTIEDIARAAGVSVSTVSRILNNKPDVAAATRQRVLQIIDRAGYQPQTEARRLRAGADQTRTIILHYPIEGSAFDPVENALVMLDFITGASRAVDAADCHLHLMTRPLDGGYLLEMFRSSQIDGAILMQVDVDDERVHALRHTAYPFTMVGRCADNTDLSFIDLSYEDATFLAFQHLIDLGHQEIGFISYPAALRQRGYGPQVRALEGYRRVLKTWPATILYEEVNIHRESLKRAAHSLLDENPAITAILTVHGEYAAGITEALHERGLSIPGDISVLMIGSQKQSEVVNPALSRVDLPSVYMGYEIAQMLLRRMDQDISYGEQIVVPPQLVLQNSTCARR